MKTKAAIRRKYGSPEVLTVEEVTKPIPNDDEILIRVHATTVNRTDCAIVTGKPFIMRFFIGLFKPRNIIPGTDFAGQIEALGQKATSFEIGDSVFGFHDEGMQTQAQYVTISEKKSIATFPTTFDYAEAVASLEGAHYAHNFINKVKIKPGQKVIEVIREFGDYIPLKKGNQISAQQLLERFMFDRKKQYDFVEKLSGGERKRLYLCTVLIQNPNFLILDEPTNDLDIVTLNVLESFLLDFPGCLLVVSHDRYFMDKIVDHLFVFRGETVVDDFPGNYSDFRTYEDSVVIENRAAKKELKDEIKNEANSWKKEEKKKLSFSEQKEFNQVEKAIKNLEAKKVTIQNKFMDTSLSGEEIANLSKELKEVEDTIETKTERWFELSAIVEG